MVVASSMIRLALAAALISSQALAAVEQTKPETRILPEQPINAEPDTAPCQRVFIIPWVMEGPDGEPIEIGRMIVAQRC